MRKLQSSAIVISYCILFFVLFLSFASAWMLDFLMGSWGSLRDFRGLILVIIFLMGYFVNSLLLYQVFLKFQNIKPGNQPIGSLTERDSNISVIFFLLYFNPLIRSLILPVPWVTLLYKALGCRIEHNSYISGILLDPFLTSIGSNTIVGHNAVIYCHDIEGLRYELNPVKIGTGVTIGAHAIVMSGVQIHDNAIVAAGAVVSKGTVIGPNEVWGGVPAKFLKSGSALKN